MNYCHRLEDFIKKNGNKHFDTIISAISYEKRSLTSIKNIIKNFTVKDVILVNFGKKYLSNEMRKKWDLNSLEIKNHIKLNNLTYKEIHCDIVYFKDSIDKFKKNSNRKRVIVNITTFPKNYILRLAMLYENIDNMFFYEKNTHYRKPTNSELKICIEKIIPIEGFEGIRDINRDDLLILLLGYEGNRALSFVSQFSPYRILPIIGIPYEGNKEIDDYYYKTVINCNWNLLRRHRILKNGDEFFKISSRNHIKIVDELDDIIQKIDYSHNDICISPLGPKPQALGLYLYWRKHPEVQLIYSVPVERFDITDQNASDSFIYQLPRKGDD